MRRLLAKMQIKTLLHVIFWLFFIMAFFVSLGFAIISYNSALRSGYDEFTAVSYGRQQLFEQLLQKTEAELLELASTNNVGEYFTESSLYGKHKQLMQIDVLSSLFFSSNPQVAGIAYVGADGHRIVRIPNGGSYDIVYALSKDIDIFAHEPRKRYRAAFLGGGVYGTVSYPILPTTGQAAASPGSLVAVVSFEQLITGAYPPDSMPLSTWVMHDGLICPEKAQTGALDGRALFDRPDGYRGQYRDGFFGNAFIYVYSIPKLGLRIADAVAYADIFRSLNAFMLRAAGIILLFMLVYGAAVLLLTNSIYKPLSAITEGLKHVGFGKRLTGGYHNEIGLISTAINNMLDEIEHMTRRTFETQDMLYQAELSKDRANLRFYTAQIRPHFFQNTLECIRSIAQEHGIEQIQSIVGCISSIVRYSLKNAVFITIAEELGALSDYLTIIEIRFQSKINLRVSCEESLFGAQCIKMILQPLVENSVTYAFPSRKRCEKIHIWISRTDDSLIIKVTDNGIGMPPEQIGRINAWLRSDADGEALEGTAFSESGSIGLKNISMRLRLHFGGEGRIELKSIPGRYTQACVRFPLRFTGDSDGATLS